MARAIRVLIKASRDGHGAAAVLDAIAASAGAERAFIVRGERNAGRLEPTILARSSPRAGVPDRPSRTVFLWALAGRRRFICPDVGDDHRFASVASVRGLGLRSVATAPLPGRPGEECAIVLDSRTGDETRLSVNQRLLDECAALASLTLERVPTSEEDDVSGDGDEHAARIVTRDRTVRSVLARLKRAARTSLPILLIGESGTGKELLARRAHVLSRCASGPFVAINCAAIPEPLLESEFFGAVRGAFTGAERDRSGLLSAADGGTLFLDEIGDMPFALQSKLLRVLQDGRYRPVGASTESTARVRVVAATHRPLESLVGEGRFRADLYWRLAVATFRIPALRERRVDIPPLAEHLARRLSRRHGLPRSRLAPCAVRALTRYRWPGNVRELEAVLARALLSGGEREIRADALDLGAPPILHADSDAGNLEVAMIRTALAASKGNVAMAAATIGWSRQKLLRRRIALGLDATDGRGGRRPPDAESS